MRLLVTRLRQGRLSFRPHQKKSSWCLLGLVFVNPFLVLFCLTSLTHIPRVVHNSSPVSNSHTLIDWLMWRALSANGSVTETTKRWFCMFFLHTFLSPPVLVLSRNRGLGSLVRGSVSIGIFGTRERSARGCHALLLLPPVTKPDPHHLLVQL